MKKLLVLTSTFLLLAAACNKQATVSPTPNPPAQGQVYENQYMKVTVPAGWNLTEATRTVQNQTYDKNTGITTKIGNPVIEKTGAVNITKGKYILYINPQASQASGVEGGRFAEIAMGAPSADAVVIEQPSPPCGTSEKILVGDQTRVDLYVAGKDIQNQSWCKAPAKGSNVWYFSYVIGKTGGYFNYYAKGDGTGYVITMAYNSKDVNSLPVKGNSALNTALSDMTGIVKSLEIKQK